MVKTKGKKAILAAKNKALLDKIKELSLRDALTGLYNYQYFVERLNVELKHAKTYKYPLSIILIDIDYFKSVNTTYGYKTGNKVLKEFANFLRRFARATDTIARYGGAEFGVLSLETNKEAALAIAKRLLENIRRYRFDAAKNKIRLKASIGITAFPEDEIDAPLWLLDAAEGAVKEAKDLGGNSIASFEAAGKAKALKAKEGVIDIAELRARLKSTGKKLDQALLESIYAFAKAIEARDYYTGKHAEKMIDIVNGIGNKLGLAQKDILNLEHAAVLHDLGKIGIDDKILRKKGKLTKKEYEEIKRHPKIGAEIIRSVHFLKDVVPLILYHHERYDGKGYTSGLRGEDIPIGARILAIADVYQALISDRPYRKAYTKKKALDIIKEASGGQFDPVIVEAFLKTIKNKKET